MKISSYISIFDDWELLKPSLWSVENLVDEIVVVDGAYEWMAPSIQNLHRDPSKSSEEVYDTLSTFGKKIRVVKGLWRNETHKRQVGYESCLGTIILRNDADEVLFWNQDAFERYLKSGCAVGQMEMPIYVAPGRIRAKSLDAPIERQSFLFDRTKINAKQHLSYLWLVLPPDERELLGTSENRLVFQEPIAFTAHLTHWRSPETAANRARFYVMNYIRSTGSLPWLDGYRYPADGGFDTLFASMSPAAFRDILMGDKIVASPPDLRGMVVRPSGQSPLNDQVFAMLYDNMLDGLARLNDALSMHPRTIANGNTYHIDASKNRSLANLQDGEAIRLYFSTNVHSASIGMSIVDENGQVTSRNLDIDIDGPGIQFSIPRLESLDRAILRRTLSLTARFNNGMPLATFHSIRQ